MVHGQEQNNCGPTSPLTLPTLPTYMFPKMKFKLKGNRFNNVLKIQQNLQHTDLIKEEFQTCFQ